MPRMFRSHQMGEEETFTVDLPNGIGAVHIRTGNVEGATGDPVVAVEVESDTLDTPAEDGRHYSTRFNHMNDTVYLTGRLPSPNPDASRSCGCGGTGTHGIDHQE